MIGLHLRGQACNRPGWGAAEEITRFIEIVIARILKRLWNIEKKTNIRLLKLPDILAPTEGNLDIKRGRNSSGHGRQTLRCGECTEADQPATDGAVTDRKNQLSAR